MALLNYAEASGQPLLTLVFAGEYAPATDMMRGLVPAQAIATDGRLIAGAAAVAARRWPRCGRFWLNLRRAASHSVSFRPAIPPDSGPRLDWRVIARRRAGARRSVVGHFEL